MSAGFWLDSANGKPAQEIEELEVGKSRAFAPMLQRTSAQAVVFSWLQLSPHRPPGVSTSAE